MNMDRMTKQKGWFHNLSFVLLEFFYYFWRDNTKQTNEFVQWIDAGELESFSFNVLYDHAILILFSTFWGFLCDRLFLVSSSKLAGVSISRPQNTTHQSGTCLGETASQMMISSGLLAN